MPTAAERAAGLLTTRGGGSGPAPAQVAAAVAVHGRGASIARVSSSTIVPTACIQRRFEVRTAMRDNRYQSRLIELLGCSPRVVVALGQLQPKWQQL